VDDDPTIARFALYIYMLVLMKHGGLLSALTIVVNRWDEKAGLRRDVGRVATLSGGVQMRVPHPFVCAQAGSSVFRRVGATDPLRESS